MELNFSKSPDGLLPAIVQDATTKTVLMLGYMNEEALQHTQASGKVTFFSRSKQHLWTKGEESGHFLNLVSLKADCDLDTLLILAEPQGPTCHKGTDSCWGEENKASYGFLTELEKTIAQRKAADDDDSYVASLFRKGINKIAQKVGEEAVETVIEAKDNDEALFLNESADLLFHYLILLQAKGYQLSDIIRTLEERKR
jgi:phosphoribosyl-AMP cyclohydrolase / phosphoribosyl-ATP pyrophosphohydrolase